VAITEWPGAGKTVGIKNIPTAAFAALVLNAELRTGLGQVAILAHHMPPEVF